MMFNFFKKTPLKVVHANELENLLESLKVREKVEHGKVKCVSCGKTLELESIGAISPQNGFIKFTCENTNCLSKA